MAIKYLPFSILVYAHLPMVCSLTYCSSFSHSFLRMCSASISTLYLSLPSRYVHSISDCFSFLVLQFRTSFLNSILPYPPHFIVGTPMDRILPLYLILVFKMCLLRIWWHEIQKEVFRKHRYIILLPCRLECNLVLSISCCISLRYVWSLWPHDV